MAVMSDHLLPDVFQDDDDHITWNAVKCQAVVFYETIGCQVFMDGCEVAFVSPRPFFQDGFVGREEAKWCVEQDGRILWVRVLHGGLDTDGFGLKATVNADNGQYDHNA